MRFLSLLLFTACTGTITVPDNAIPISKFSPEPYVEQSTRSALVRWVTATGINLTVSEAGIPVIAQEDWIYVNGKSNCGNMDFVNREITVTTNRNKCDYFSFESLILHEVGHAIAGIGGHTETGIMAPGGKAEDRECINTASLELICLTADCQMFQPECD